MYNLYLPIPGGSLKATMDSFRLPESSMPQAQSLEEGQKSVAGDELANGIRNDKGAWNLASRLYHLEGFRKSEVAAYLQKK
jgi:PH/SEC7 domain-containing protein